MSFLHRTAAAGLLLGLSGRAFPPAAAERRPEEGQVLLQVSASAPTSSTGKVAGAQGARAPPLRWGFNGSDLNATALHEFIAWDREQGWSAVHRPGVNFADTAAWPPMPAPATGHSWDTGLKNPRVVVLSMRQRLARRKSFSQQYQKLGWNLGAEWAAAVDGSAMPTELRWLKGYEDKQVWDHDKPGNWGCYLSHLAILRDSQAKCPTCDLVVFEDDAVFAPGWRERWEAFFTSLPQDWSIVRLGAQSLWEPSFEASPSYIRAKAVANTWGYVVRAEGVGRLADLLAGLPVRGAWGVDAVMQLFTKELKTYVPSVPMVYAVGDCSDSSATSPGHGCEKDGEAGLQRRINSLVAKWPQGYFRTYCQAPGVLDSYHEQVVKDGEAPGCKDRHSATCCPYVAPLNFPP